VSQDKKSIKAEISGETNDEENATSTSNGQRLKLEEGDCRWLLVADRLSGLIQSTKCTTADKEIQITRSDFKEGPWTLARPQASFNSLCLDSTLLWGLLLLQIGVAYMN
jgi:hypothetical protein